MDASHAMRAMRASHSELTGILLAQTEEDVALEGIPRPKEGTPRRSERSVHWRLSVDHVA